MVIQVYALTINAEETEVEWFYEELQDLLELTPQKEILFIVRGSHQSSAEPGVNRVEGLGRASEGGAPAWLAETASISLPFSQGKLFHPFLFPSGLTLN